MTEYDRTYPKMNPEEKEKWLAALATYEQATGFLHIDGDGFCCLGVYADISGCTWSTIDEGDGLFPFLNGELAAKISDEDKQPMQYLGNALLEKAGLTHSTALELADMNDNGETFQTISSFIRENL